MVTETERIAILLSLETEAFERKAKSSAAAISKLEARYDPLVAAAKRFEVEQAQLSRALEKGTIDQTKYASTLKLVTAGYEAQKAKITGARDAVANMNSAVTAQTGFLNRNKSVFQMAGYQVGDFAVQVQGGTSAVTAFTQQGSQMLGAFGPLGAILGAVLAVGLPVGAALYNMAGGAGAAGAGAMSLKDSLSSLSEIQGRLQETTNILGLSADEMAKKYGAAAESVRQNVAALAALQVADARAALSNVVLESAEAWRQYSVGVQKGSADARGQLQQMTMALNAIENDLGVTGDGARDLVSAFSALRIAMTFEDKIAAIEGLGAALASAGVSMEVIPAELRSAIIEAREANAAMADLKVTADATALAAGGIVGLFNEVSDAIMVAAKNAGILADSGPVAGWLSGAISDAQTLGATLWEAARAAAAARGGAVVNANPEKGPAFEGKGRSATSSASYVAPAPTLDEVITKYAPKTKSKGGGGGADKEANDLLKERDALLKSLQTPQQAYQDSIANIDKLQKAGLLTSEQYNLAIADVTANYDKARLAGNEWAQFIDGDLKDSFVDFALGADDAFGNIEESIKKALVQLLLFNEGMFANKTSGGTGLLGGLFSGGSGGGLLSGIFGGFRASGGPVSSSKSYVVGEEGPEMFTPSTSGTIIPNGAAVAGGGTSTIQISLGEGLVGSILTQAAGQSVQITSAASSAQQRSLKGAVSSAQARGTS